nr:hypothetical protein [bacterium]
MIKLIHPFPSPLDTLHAWREGDAVIAVDDKPIEDMLDLYYYTPAGDEMVLTIRSADGAESRVAMAPGALD